MRTMFTRSALLASAASPLLLLAGPAQAADQPAQAPATGQATAEADAGDEVIVVTGYRR